MFVLLRVLLSDALMKDETNDFVLPSRSTWREQSVIEINEINRNQWRLCFIYYDLLSSTRSCFPDLKATGQGKPLS